MTLLGTIRVARPYYHCRPCRAGHNARDAALGVGADQLTRGATEVVVLAGAVGRFAEAKAKTLPKLCGLRLGESTIERTTERFGGRFGAVGPGRRPAVLLRRCAAAAHHQAPRQAGRGEPHQPANRQGERVGRRPPVFAALEWDVEAVLLPGPIKERHEPMVEEVEPIAEGVVVGVVGDGRNKGLRVMRRQDAVRPIEAEECHRQQRHRAVGSRRCEGVNLARRKRQRRVLAEPHRLGVRQRVGPDGLARAVREKRPHGREKIELPRGGSQPVEDGSRGHGFRGGFSDGVKGLLYGNPARSSRWGWVRRLFLANGAASARR